MPDISMCGTQDCPLRDGCYRSPESGTKPHEWRQAWSAFTWLDCDGQPVCEYYWPTRSEAREKEGRDA